MNARKPCPCGRRPELSASYAISCKCPNCYDGSPDAKPEAQWCGWGHTARQAIEDWNQIVSERT